jgi:hypothetical protein
MIPLSARITLIPEQIDTRTISDPGNASWLHVYNRDYWVIEEGRIDEEKRWELYDLARDNRGKVIVGEIFNNGGVRKTIVDYDVFLENRFGTDNPLV